MSVVKSLHDAAGRRRVDIVKRPDGAFTFQGWHFSEHPDEMCWIPDHQQMVTVTDSAEAAEREARARVDWLLDEDPV